METPIKAHGAAMEKAIIEPKAPSLVSQIKDDIMVACPVVKSKGELEKEEALNLQKQKDTLEGLRTVIKDGHVSLYLIKRTDKKNVHDKRVVLKAEIGLKAAVYFKQVLSTAIDIMTYAKEFNDFKELYEAPCDQGVVPYIDDFKSIPDLPDIISKLNKDKLVERVTDLDAKLMNNVVAYGVEVMVDEVTKIAFFTRHTPRKIFSANKPLFSLHKGVFNKIDDVVFTFDESVDCVYCEADGSNRMFILDVNGFEGIFECTKRYKVISRRALVTLKDYDFIEINEEAYGKITQRKRYLKKITALMQLDGFTGLTIDFVRKVADTTEHKLKFIIADDKLVLDTEEAIMDFVDVLKDHIVLSARDPHKLLRASRTTEIK